MVHEANQRYRAIARSVAESEFLPVAAQIDEQGGIQYDMIEKLAATGWFGVCIPEQYGGLGLGHVAKSIFIEEVSRCSGAAGATLQSAQLGIPAILDFGSDQQKQRLLPKLASGELIASICVSEPESGSHLMAMQTTAVRDGAEYVLNGRKWFVANSHVANLHGVIARTGEGSRGFSFFLVERDRPGFRAGVTHDAAGLRGLNFGEVIFEDCRIPASNLIGVEGQGMKIAHNSINNCGKANFAAVSLGIHQAVLDACVAYAEQRTMYGAPMSEMDSARSRVANIYMRLEMCRLAAYDAVSRLDRGEDAVTQLVLAKLANTEQAVESARQGVELLGARGILREFKLERYLRDAITCLMPAGTSDIQRKRLADHVFKGSASRVRLETEGNRKEIAA